MKTIQCTINDDNISHRPIRVTDEEAEALVKTGKYRYVPRSLYRFFMKRAAMIRSEDLMRRRM